MQAHDLSNEEIRVQLQRLLESHLFRAAHGQRKFLKFVVEETLEGRGHQIKEFTVGVAAFERGDHFDPRVDPIIRTEARKLRARLVKYYDGEGRWDPIRIDLPKGTYMPSFERQNFAAETDCAQPMSVVVEPEPVAEPQPEPVAEPVAELSAPKPSKRHTYIYAAAAGLFIAAALAWFLFSRNTVTARVNTLAVMPFKNRTGDLKQDSLADGLTASLIESFERDPGLRVAGRRSVMQLTAAHYIPSEVKQRLGVNSILTGGIEKQGNSLRLRVRLVDRDDSVPIWSGSYTFEPITGANIESEIAAEVAHVLHTGKAITEPAAQSVSSAASSAYLEGLHYQGRLQGADLSKAIEQFEKAINIDPAFARAYSALATSWIWAGQINAIPPKEIVQKVKQYANRALELDRTLGDPHFSLAVCAEYDFDWPRAEKEFQTGLALSPSSSLGHLWYAKFLALNGRLREVLVHRTIASELDPLSPNTVQALAGYWSVMGEYRQAINGFRSALSLDPTFGLARQGLGVAYLLDGQQSKAIEELEAANALQHGIRTRALLGYAYGRTGRTTEARNILAGFLEAERRGPFPPLAIAHIYIGLGDNDKAFQWLEKAVEQHDLSATLKWDSIYQPLRSDQRFSGLLRRMKLE